MSSHIYQIRCDVSNARISKKWCKNKPACWKCGSEGHDGSDCTSETVCCLNCKGDHYASAKSCTVWIQEKEIQRVKTEKSLSYGHARSNRGMFETQKVRRHDKFRKEWSQQLNKCKSQMGQDQVSGGDS